MRTVPLLVIFSTIFFTHELQIQNVFILHKTQLRFSSSGKQIIYFILLLFKIQIIILNNNWFIEKIFRNCHLFLENYLIQKK